MKLAHSEVPLQPKALRAASHANIARHTSVCRAMLAWLPHADPSWLPDAAQERLRWSAQEVLRLSRGAPPYPVVSHKTRLSVWFCVTLQDTGATLRLAAHLGPAVAPLPHLGEPLPHLGEAPCAYWCCLLTACRARLMADETSRQPPACGTRYYLLAQCMWSVCFYCRAQNMAQWEQLRQ